MPNQINQQSNADPRGKAIASLVLGISSLIIGIDSVYNAFFGGPIDEFLHRYDYNLTVFLIMNLFISGLGITLGKTGLRSTKKGLAIAGIILSIIGLLGATFFYLFIKMMASTF